MARDLRKLSRLKNEYAQLLVPLIAMIALVIFNLIRDPAFSP